MEKERKMGNYFPQPKFGGLIDQRNMTAMCSLFSFICSNVGGNEFPFKDGNFTMRVVKHWNRFSRELVDASSLETFKVRLDGALSNLI